MHKGVKYIDKGNDHGIRSTRLSKFLEPRIPSSNSSVAGTSTKLRKFFFRFFLHSLPSHLPWKKLRRVLTIEGTTPVVPFACLDIPFHSSDDLLIVGPSVLIGGGTAAVPAV
jgi:hypothetical protein